MRQRRAVKFQVYSGAVLYSAETPRSSTSRTIGSATSELLDAIALPREWLPELVEHAT